MWSSKLWLGLAGAIALLAPAPAPAAVDLAVLAVAPERGHPAESAPQNLYECHN